MADTADTNGEMNLEQLETILREKIDKCDRQITEARNARKALDSEIKRLTAEKDRAMRMLPRAPRVRRSSTPVT